MLVQAEFLSDVSDFLKLMLQNQSQSAGQLILLFHEHLLPYVQDATRHVVVFALMTEAVLLFDPLNLDEDAIELRINIFNFIFKSIN